MFLLLQLPYPISVLLLTSRCKSSPAQYKHCPYYLVFSQSLSRIQIKTKLMLCKSFMEEFKAFKSYTTVQKRNASVAKVGVAHA